MEPTPAPRTDGIEDEPIAAGVLGEIHDVLYGRLFWIAHDFRNMPHLGFCY